MGSRIPCLVSCALFVGGEDAITAVCGQGCGYGAECTCLVGECGEAPARKTEELDTAFPLGSMVQCHPLAVSCFLSVSPIYLRQPLEPQLLCPSCASWLTKLLQ